jgi:putative redox protein
MEKPPVRLLLSWAEDLVFRAEVDDGRELLIDGDSRRSLSPVELLAVAVTGCMAADVVHILTRARQPLRGLRASFTGLRAASDPHRFVKMRLEFIAEGPVAPAKLERALELSTKKYCSVLNTLREDMTLELLSRVETGPGPGG